MKIMREDRKSLISIRPVCRLAGRGLDGNTHAPLVSLADRLTSSPSGHLTLRAFLDPFHALISFANWFDKLLPRQRLRQLEFHTALHG